VQVDGVSCSYVIMWNAFKKLSENYAPAERRMLLRDNAIAFYGLQLDNAASHAAGSGGRLW